MKTRIPLEELLLDSPQNRTLVRLFEEDTYNLRSWSHQLRSALDEWCVAQRTATAAASKLASVITAYNNQKLPLDVAAYEMPSLTQRLAQNVDEIASWMELLVQQVGFCVQGPIDKAVQEMDQLVETVRPEYADALSNMADADERFARAGRKETSRRLEELNNDVFISRMSYHKLALSYCSRMNVLQSRRYNELIEPLLMLVYAFKCFFNVGHDAFSKGALTDFLTQAQQHMLTIGKETEADRTENNQLLRALSELCNKQHDIYYGEQPQSVCSVCDDVHKQGYLRIRLKSGLFTNNWHKYYVFTQGTKLMWQKADQLAGSLMLDLIQVPGTSAQVTGESADRRFVFSVCLPGNEEDPAGERRWLLQARNAVDMQEWVSVINNLAGMQLHSDQSASPTEQTAQPLVQPIQFDVTDSCEQHSLTSDLSSAQHMDVRFLGRVQAESAQTDMQTTIQLVLTARLTHAIVDSTACGLVLSADAVLLVSREQPEHVKTRVLLKDVVSWCVSQHDDTVLGLLSRTTEQASHATYLCTVLAADPTTSTAAICDALNASSHSPTPKLTLDHNATSVNGAEVEMQRKVVVEHSATETQKEMVATRAAAAETQREVVATRAAAGETQREVVAKRSAEGETQKEAGATGGSSECEEELG